MELVLRIRGKGKRFRDLLLSEPARDVLVAWGTVREGTKNLPTTTNRSWIEFGRSDYLFPSKNGAPYQNLSFNRQMLVACRHLKLPKLTAHGLRHSLAYHLLNDQRRNLREIQEILGHKLIGTTQRYTQVDREQLKAAVGSIGVLP
jgi:site-specific recombinase XerD